ncbi:MAG TPA: nuclear transport factor 2 family protein [Actinomycetota bacterium]|nr:nuclear transport factor 2 family protein [Actinomycetota bacterium]
MSERDEFLEAVLPRLTEADTAFHNGDANPRLMLWSENDPVTLFGAALTATGREKIASTFEWLAEGFSDCESFEYEVVAADASGDLAYMVGIEHTTASVRGAPPQPYALRVTTIFRREDDGWRVVHRHGDPVPESVSARDQLKRMVGEDREA